MLVVRKFASTLTRLLCLRFFFLHFLTPGQTWSNLPTCTNPGTQLSFSLFISLPGLCLSLVLSQMLFFCLPQTHTTLFFSDSHFVSIIIFLHLVPCDAVSPSHILFASPSLSSLPLSSSIPISSCFLHVSFHHNLPTVLLLPQLVACWRGLLHWVGWNLTWQVPRLWQEGKCIFWSLHPEMTHSHFFWHWSEG